MLGVLRAEVACYVPRTPAAAALDQALGRGCWLDKQAMLSRVALLADPVSHMNGSLLPVPLRKPPGQSTRTGGPLAPASTALRLFVSYLYSRRQLVSSFGIPLSGATRKGNGSRDKASGILASVRRGGAG